MNRDITPFSGGTPAFHLPLLCSLPLTLESPWHDDPQPVSDFFFFKYPSEGACPFEATDTLTIVVAMAVQLVLSLPDLVLESFHRVHCSTKA
jgi:hypothetical protein